MKKMILLGAATMFALAGMAQSTKPIHRSTVQELPMMQKQMQLSTQPETVKKARRKTFGDGVYYVNPSGAYYGGWDTFTGIGYRYSTLIVPPFTEIPFENKSTQDIEWTIAGEPVSENYIDGNFFKSTSYRTFGSYLDYPPSVEGKTTYTFGEMNYLKLNGYITSEWQDGLIRTDSLATLYLTDPHAAIEYQGKYYGPYQSWGIFDTDNLFGSGVYYEEDENKNVSSYRSVGAIQVCPTPISPLFITEIDVEALTAAKQPIPEDLRLTAYITGVRESHYSDGTPYTTADFNNVIATLYCTSADTLDFYSTTTRNSKTLKTGTLRFMAPGEDDELGNVIPQNLVLDQAFAVVFTGFDQEGIDCGLYGMEVVEEDQEYKESAKMLVVNEEDANIMFGYNGFITLAMSFYGMFDKAYAEPQVNFFKFENPDLSYNVVRIPAEGSDGEYGFSNLTEGSTNSPLLVNDETADGFPGVPVLTNVYWFDEENEVLNYDVIDLPDWIESYSVDPTYYEDGGLNIVMFKAKPLPEGVSGRMAVVHVIGQEVVMNDETKYSAISGPIYILQGDASVDGINNATLRNSNFTGTTYNLAGQKVNSAFKGITIQNGKKFVVK